MSTKLAIAAALFAVLCGPALAGDQDVATLLRDSGRYVPDANLPGWSAHIVPSGAYASAAPVMRVPAQALAVTARDFQLQGR
jgi:hypothetical protein